VDSTTLHQAEPPLHGAEKWMTNLWIWDPAFTPNVKNVQKEAHNEGEGEEEEEEQGEEEQSEDEQE